MHRVTLTLTPTLTRTRARARTLTLTLTLAQEIPVYGAKSLSCRFCTLDLHGRPLLDGRTHTKLNQTAAAGATELWLREPVDWPVGSQVLITSTSADGALPPRLM